jgi:colicin import membrane protein
MSTVSDRRPRESPADPDPFRYGWRYVRVTRPDGTEWFDQVPLTLEDVLHPEEEDFIVQTDAHDSDRAYLKAVSKVQMSDDPTAVVLSDCRVDFNIPGVKPLGPDLSVFTGARRRIMWTTFNVASEGARPMLVIEVTSPETRNNDVGIKVEYYRRGRVPWYLIADVTIEEEGERRIELILYRRVGRTYRLVPVNDQGRVWLEPLGLWLGQTRDAEGGFMRLACYDATGAEVGDYTAISRALAESQERLTESQGRLAESQGQLAKESRARERAQRRARSEAKARAQAEQARAQAEQARAQAEQAREVEARARDQAEATIRALQVALERLRRPES